MNAAPTRSESAGDPARALAAARAGALSGFSPDAPAGAPLREALTAAYEQWLRHRAEELGVIDGSGFAIIAVGALGRRETVPGSDLDLVLLHEDRHPERLGSIADGLWYPIWDSGLSLDHSVRTLTDAVQAARGEPTATLGLLDARFIAGDADLAALLVDAVRNLWRIEARLRLPEVLALTRERWGRNGDNAQRAQPDLKNGRGGLRDVQLLNALALAQLTDGLSRLRADEPGTPVALAYRRLLDVRTQHHLITGRSRDRLPAEDAGQLAAALGLEDRFALARLLSDAARTVDFAVETGIRTAGHAVGRRGLSRLRRLPVRTPLDEGVVRHDGEVALARSALPSQDEGLVFRVAAAAARHDLPINGPALERLARYAPAPTVPWPAEPLSDLLVLLASGPSTARTVEALDRIGLWGKLFPEWDGIRDLAPRDPVHVWTVDRHSVETVIGAAALTTRVSRPDLLLLAALIHDIGKGRGGDHSVLGAELARDIGRRLGVWPADVELLAAAVRHHLLLPSTATRRDCTDPRVVAEVADTLGHNRDLVELLGALAEADGEATGPAAWSDWKAGLVADLTARVATLIGGGEVPTPEPLTEEQDALARGGGLHVQLEAGEGTTYLVTMVAPDRRGVLSAAAAVLAVAGLTVHAAQVRSAHGHALDTFAVATVFGGPPDVAVLRQRFRAALDGRLDLPPSSTDDEVVVTAPPHAEWIDDPATGAVLLQVRSADRPGLLAAITAVLERAGAAVVWAKVNTLGATVIDTFCVEPTVDSPAARASIGAAVLRVCPGPASRPD
ncbi:[protein-PII] uridylyltransferase [Gordonia alkaliphila]|uniref:[protein-PII] uridylyltransferase n=1 Tax=Gordonia alkaliphila TaxID=1053547 RepID=UPI001FF2AAC8|nr:[protein-PII] uridylyltransferase [Gordonia alkaliphila]MCK0440326.1 [protein-PII] uridylyltransferase [Gordonia alkaliphila]